MRRLASVRLRGLATRVVPLRGEAAASFLVALRAHRRRAATRTGYCSSHSWVMTTVRPSALSSR